MGSSISKQKNKLGYKVSKINLNRAIKKYNKKYGDNISYYKLEYTQKDKRRKKNKWKSVGSTSSTRSSRNVDGMFANVKIRYITSPMGDITPNLKYSYVYKGVPGGWY